ncbi:MAG: HAMP domain-containing histidine kinase [Saprospiraceae bacterium]|jgi:two-component sensor histidine kinase|nr:HAMP domain-containing histidine kinase [Saprospiraceae bacterium]
MFTTRTFLFARALMALSLLLLGCSLSWFLWRTYAEEKAALSREVSYVFINTIRNIEGGLLDKLVFRRNAADGHPLPNLPQVFVTDSVKIMTFVGRDEQVVDTSGRNLEIRVSRTGGDEMPASEIQGSISMFIAMAGDSMVRGPGHLMDTAAFLPRLRKEFDYALAAAGLPVQHRISRVVDGQPETPRVLRSGLYTDLANGERYGAELSGYELFLVKKMLPQILFATLLFGCVALAFFFVFRAFRAQKRLADLKTEFVQNISHELKTPIATMSVALEALRNFDALKNPGQTKEYLDISQLELQRLSLLVEKVLGIAQMERAGAVLSTAVFDFRDLTEEVLAALRPRIEQAGASVALETDGASFQVNGDRLHLAGVLYNLLDNALKYGGTPTTVRVRLYSEPGKLRLLVQDDGPGIPPQHRARIFEAFFRVPSQAGHQVKGHGLGLSYAAKVVEQHGGKIMLDSEPGHGAIFTVELPAHA